MLLTWDDEDCLGPYQSSSGSTFYVNATAWSRGLEVTGGGTGVVSHAGNATYLDVSRVWRDCLIGSAGG